MQGNIRWIQREMCSFYVYIASELSKILLVVVSLHRDS